MHTLDLLPNGLRVATEIMPHMESVSLGVWIRAGGRYEDARTSGISHMLEHLLFKGTETRDMKKIKEEIEGRGGTFNGFTAEECTCYLVKLLAKDISLGVDMLSDMVLHPRLDAAEVAKEKDVVVEEINMYKDMPAQHVHELLSEMMWPNQPLGMPLAGRVESVRALTREDIADYKKRYYTPANILVAGAGKIDEGSLAKLSQQFFAKALAEKAPAYAPARVAQKQQEILLHTKDTEQTHLALGFHAPDRFSPDRFTVSVINILLGANMSSRLFHIVRDEMALCYEISSGVRKYEDAGAFLISAGVDTAKTTKALELILKVIASLAKEPVGADELRRAKEYYKGQLLFALEDTMSLMLWLGEKAIAGEKEFDVRKILQHIDAVTPADIMRVAGSIFTNTNLNCAVIGPIKNDRQLREVLSLS